VIAVVLNVRSMASVKRVNRFSFLSARCLSEVGFSLPCIFGFAGVFSSEILYVANF